MKKLISALLVTILFSACADESKKTTSVTSTDSTTTAIAPSQSDTGVVAPQRADESTESLPSSADAVTLKFNLPKGKPYSYEMNFALTQEMQERSMNTNMDMRYLMEVVDEAAGVRTIKATYDRLAMSMNMGGQKMEFSSENKANSTDPTQMIGGMFAAIKGKSFTIKVDPKGNILSVTGIDQIGDAVVKEMQVPEQMKPAILQNFKRQFNNKGVKEAFAQTFEIFPDKPVRIGDSWDRKASTPIGAPGNMVTHYTVKDIKGNKVTISATSDIEIQRKEGNMAGSQESIMVLDAQTGLVTSGSFDQQFSGPMKMKSKGTITGKML